MNTLTPMVSDYMKIKAQLPAGTILFFRLGDFLEAFADDATTAAPIMGTVVTKRSSVPMTGIPVHSQARYFHDLLAAGHKVAIADYSVNKQAATR